MKSLLNNRYLLKVSSTSLAKAGWNLTLTRNEALKNNELVSLASSTVLRMIDKINGEDFREKEERIKQLKQEIGLLKNLKNDAKTRAKMIEKQTEFNKLVFMEDYLCVVIDSKKHYDRANKGFIVNGVDYVRLLATSAGVKKNTIVYVSKKCKDTLTQWLNAERDETVKFVPAKLEAYISLACSASIPVSNPNGVLVVHDIETKFKDDVILVDGLNSKRPKVEIVKDYETTLNAFDGGGLILPSLAKRWAEELEEDYLFSACCLRHAFCKGMLNTFDFIQFAEEVANTYEVTDVWGEVHDIRNIEIVLTTSMLKLWDSYSSINDYLEKASRNNHTFAITKITPKELDNVQSMNYQFLQSLHLSDEDIKELIKPTIEEIDDILNYDYRKSILYLRGMDLKEKTIRNDKGDYTRALMIDKNMLNDPYTYSKIKNNIKNRIDQAKLGVINVKGNFSILSGDPYILCESMFGLEPKGLLKPGEIYSKYWIDRDVKEVGMFRAPTTNKQSNLVREIASTDEMLKWYKYMNTVTILNAWDNTTAALNGADFDNSVTLSK